MAKADCAGVRESTHCFGIFQGNSIMQRTHATARYIAPVSKQEKPSSFATAFATVDLPAPEGPSIAMIIYANPFKHSRNVGKLTETLSKSIMSTGVSEHNPTKDQVIARR